MQRLPQRRRDFLNEATAHYESQVGDEVIEHLLGHRGARVANDPQRYRLGYVGDPMPGHEKYVGRLAIPYVTPSGVVDIRYRCLEEHSCKEAGHGKFLGDAGVQPSLYNVLALHSGSPVVAICEGEPDVWAVEQYAGIPAVGVPGATQWRSNPHWRRVFEGFQLVAILSDGDKSGEDMLKRVEADLFANGQPVPMPDGMDATEFLLEKGGPALRERIGLDKGEG